MAKVAEGALKNWNDGDVVKAFDYKQEREILKTAINANDDSIKTVEDEIRGNNGLANRMTNAEGRIGVAERDVDNLETRSSNLESRASASENRLGTVEPKVTSNTNEINSLKFRATSGELRTSNLEQKARHLSTNGENFVGRWHGLTTTDLFNRLNSKPSLLVSPNLKVWEFHVSNNGAIETTEVLDGFRMDEVQVAIEMRSENGSRWKIGVDDDGLLVSELINEVSY